MLEKTRRQRFFKRTEAYGVCGRQFSITSVERFEYSIDPALSYLITIALIAGLNQVRRIPNPCPMIRSRSESCGN